MNELVTAQTLYNYFENNATLREKQLIKEWLKQDGHEEIFYHHLAVWESLHLQVDVDADQALERYRKVLAGEMSVRTIPSPRTASPMQRRIRRYAYMACAAIFVLSLSLFYYQHYYIYTTYLTAYGMTRDIVLEDGSEVILNANSSLKVRKQLDGHREVWLEGEAFFSIAKKPDSARFVVHTNNLNVEVLGTKFNVSSRREETEVVLKEGSIRLTSGLPEVKEGLLMKPGDLVSLSDHDVAFRMKTVQPDRYSAWRNNMMVFEDAPLSVVAQEIEDYYGMPVEITDKELLKSQLTGTLPNNNLGIVLKSLSASLKLTVVRKDDKIILTR
jgi:ferric-dicitrate binding protein FerR (iron transport regulator)